MDSVLAQIISEGFQHMHKCMQAVVAETRSIGIGHHSCIANTDKAMADLKEWAEGGPDDDGTL